MPLVQRPPLSQWPLPGHLYSGPCHATCTVAATFTVAPPPTHDTTSVSSSASPSSRQGSGCNKKYPCQNHAKPCTPSKCHAKSSKIMSCKTMRKTVQNEILLQAVHTCTPCSNSIFSAQNRAKSSRPYVQVENARPTKKNWARKKRMASWARQRQQITEAADGGARARTGADGAVVLNLRRGPGAYALLSRAEGS